jgi:apolipoprotein N-acyltransferase
MRSRTIFLIISSACLLVLSFPNLDQPYCIWFALVPLLFAAEGKNGYRSFLMAWLCGFLFYAGLMYWIVVVTTTYGKLPYPAGVLLMLMLSGFLALYFALPFALVRFVEAKYELSLPLLLPVFWVALEYIRSFLFSGFPWENLGYSPYRLLPLMQFADITGVYGISFLIVLVNAVLYLVLRGIALKQLPWKAIAVTILMLASALGYGRIRLQEVAALSAGSPSLTVGLIQGNIPQDIKWDAAFRDEALKRHRDLTLSALQAGAELVVWPESATPFYFQNEPEYQAMLFDLIRDSRSYLLIGSPSLAVEQKHYVSFNSAFLLTPDAAVAGRYDKIHLVPYGEYVPLKELLFFVNKMVEGIGDFRPGKGISLMPLPASPFGVLICYEIIFPDLTRRFVKQGAGFLVTITNDAWFGNTGAPYQHFSMAVVRAIENKRWVARAANTGISGIISPTGTIQAASTVFTEAFLTGSIHPLQIITFYTRYGDIFALSLCAVAFALLTAALFKKSIINQFDK